MQQAKKRLWHGLPAHETRGMNIKCGNLSE